MQRTHRWLTSLIMLLLTVAALPGRAAAVTGERCFGETGYCISGPIRDFWERNGGLAVFGYPISAQQIATIEGTWTGPVQWFERDRLEDHTADGQGVLGGRLGALTMGIQGRDWQRAPRETAQPGCRYFSETGFNLCGVFLRYWESNGGLMRFGYPISAAMMEATPDWSGTVQYFERRRMEHHTELAGTPYEVLLGLLGRDVRQFSGYGDCSSTPRIVADAFAPLIAAAPFRAYLRCAQAPQAGIPAAVQRFVGGVMIWFDEGRGQPKIIVLKGPDRPAPYATWWETDDTWYEGYTLPEWPAPQGYVLPVRGFGKLWYGSRGQGQWIGYALAPEQATRAYLQRYAGGGMIISLDGGLGQWLLGPESGQIVGPVLP